MKVEMREGEAEKVVVDELLWMYEHDIHLSKKEKKAYRTVLKHYMLDDEFKQTFRKHGVYK